MADYQKKTVAELTEILKSRSLPHTGKKADLIARLTEADKAEEVPATEHAPSSVEPPLAAPAPPAPSTTTNPTSSGEKATNQSSTGVPPVTQTATSAPPTSVSAPASIQAVQEQSQTARESSTGTDAALASATTYSLGLSSSALDDEIRRRKARAERFGLTATSADGGGDDSGTSKNTTDAAGTLAADTDAVKALERAKRFGISDGAGTVGTGVGRLDEALPAERERGGGSGRGMKRARDGEGITTNGGGLDSYDDPGLKARRGGKRRLGSNGGRKPEGVQKSTGSAGSAYSQKDQLAAEARKKRFTAMS